MDRFPHAGLLAPLQRPADAAPPARVALLRRTLLIVGAIAALAVAWAVSSGAAPPADRELFWLLRAMAAIKGLFALGAAVAVGWRLGSPVTRPVAGAYLVGTWSMFAAAGLIWQVTLVPIAALLFHAAALGVLVVSTREGLGPWRRWRPAPSRALQPRNAKVAAGSQGPPT